MSIMERQINLAEMTGETIVGEGVRFERIRRITGYLVGTLDRFNNGKLAEVKDRVAHLKIDWIERHKA